MMKNNTKKESEAIPFVVKDLEQAIATLEKFSHDTISPFALTLPGSQFSLGDTIRHVGKLVVSSFSQKDYHRLVNQNAKAKHALTKAIETLKNCYPLLEKYQHGTPCQKKLATLAIEAVQRFNDSIDKHRLSPNWRNKIASFFFKEHLPTSWFSEKDKIDLPIAAIVLQERPSSRKEDFSLPTLFNLVACNNSEMTANPEVRSPSKQASDMFRMKAIRLLRDHKIPVKYENLQFTPIRLQKRDSSDEDHHILSLFQTLRPLPGEVIELKGNIKKNNECESRPIPLPDSFHLATTAFQTGFPHPLQHTGWAFANALIPAFPHRQEMLTLFSPIQKQMREVALSLLPKGSNNAIAKELLCRKRTEFHLRKKTFLSLHKQLSFAIINASHETDDATTPQCHHNVETFFNMLEELPNSYDYLAETVQSINETFIHQPYERLQYIRLHDPTLQERVRKAGYHEIYEILSEEAEKGEATLREHLSNSDNPLEVATINYILTMSRVLKRAFFFIMIQEKSEIIGFPPPLFTCFTRKVQAATFKQLIQFNNEILAGDTTPANIEALLEERLIEDIALFENENADNLGLLSDLVNELEEYYNLRYYSRRKKGF